jgi:ketosteroid isomerase-like protein
MLSLIQVYGKMNVSMSPIESQVWKTVQDLNHVWTVDRDASKLSSYFHPNMIAIVPNMRERLVGRDACIAGWDSFVKIAEINEWREFNPQVDIYNAGQTAIVTYHYEAQCTFGGKPITLRGRDMMTLILEGGKWWVVADQFSPEPSVGAA